MNKVKNKRIEKIKLPKRQFIVKMNNYKVKIGRDEDLVIIVGPCVIDSKKMIFQTAKEIVKIAERSGINVIFKSSYEKDNRGNEKNWKGPLISEGLKILSQVRKEFNIPVLSDIHRHEDINIAADHLDVLQIPAYLCQQTSLVIDAAKTKLPINVKKGQFLAPENMKGVVSKINSVGNKNVLLTERGTCFGYNRLVFDVRSIPIMQEIGVPVCVDPTHIIRLYGISSADPAGGEPRFIPHLTLASVAIGADALFIETHPNPMKAKCDAASQLDLKFLENLLKVVIKIRKVIGSPEKVNEIFTN